MHPQCPLRSRGDAPRGSRDPLSLPNPDGWLPRQPVQRGEDGPIWAGQCPPGWPGRDSQAEVSGWGWRSQERSNSKRPGSGERAAEPLLGAQTAIMWLFYVLSPDGQLRPRERGPHTSFVRHAEAPPRQTRQEGQREPFRGRGRAATSLSPAGPVPPGTHCDGRCSHSLRAPQGPRAPSLPGPSSTRCSGSY